ncbi:MAG: tetratricopeptide repeat protein [Candidatus Wallbacteria bacterium]|nr:tetratricopeptide repeat protein [Candidatus Wallbacteria bacterium]
MQRSKFHFLAVLGGVAMRLMRSSLSVAGVRAAVYTVAIAALLTTLLELPAAIGMDGSAYNQRGLARLRAERYQGGLADLERAARIEPANLSFQQHYAEALLVMGQPEKALDVLRQAWSIEPSRWTLILMGSAYRDLKLHEAAIGCFTDARALDKRGGRWDRESWEHVARVSDSRVAQCYIRMEQPGRAIALLEPALGSGRRAGQLQSSEPHFWLGVAYWMDGQKELALAQWQDAVRIDPSDTGSTYNIACYHAVRGNPLKALAYLEQAVDRGFFEPEYFDWDTDMASLRNLPQFQRLAQRVRDRAARMEPVASRSPAAVRELIDDLKSRRESRAD